MAGSFHVCSVLTRLVDLCDLLLVFHRDRNTGEIDGPALSEQAVGRVAGHGFVVPLWA
jgi:hypothetical protein